ncbi:antibiotic biosynthesis monooxygenase [Kutzneria sp. NPDC052558]|uniref:antibiotic biosynthesis monooxygenase n=1 Tax=Kutzneria sp. NPDC052558 TaxID=3364121 RepID=UPI0037C68474
MSRTVMVRYRTRPEAAEENQRLVEAVFRELNADDPGGLRYATFRLDDGVTFVHVARFEGEDNPLQRSAAFKEFQQDVGARMESGPERSDDVTLVGEYGF